jgi:hypothetical protein
VSRPHCQGSFGSVAEDLSSHFWHYLALLLGSGVGKPIVVIDLTGSLFWLFDSIRKLEQRSFIVHSSP